MASLILRSLALRASTTRASTLRMAAAALSLTMLCFAGRPSTSSSAQEADLYAQATAAMLDRSFPARDVDYLLLDVQTRRVIAMRWPHAETAIPVGSLLKPFVALAFAAMHESAGAAQPGNADLFPAVVCHGKKDGCWRTGGHGSLRLEQALAESCNAYFLALARSLAGEVSGEDALLRVTRRYALPAPPPLAHAADAPGMLIGVSPEWRMRPAALADAYAELARGPQTSTTVRLLAGMTMAAQPGGTAARVGHPAGGVLAKTGTAPCVPLTGAAEDRCRVNGDGLAVVIAPAEARRMLLLVRQRGTTGATAAELAGRMLAQIEEARAAN